MGFGSLRWLVGVPFHFHFADISCFGMSAEFLIYATSKGVLHYVLLADMSFVNEYNAHPTASRRVVASLRRRAVASLLHRSSRLRIAPQAPAPIIGTRVRIIEIRVRIVGFQRQPPADR